MNYLKPGSPEAKRMGCKCTYADQDSAIDDAVNEATGMAPHHATGLPMYDSSKCPLPLHNEAAKRSTRLDPKQGSTTE